MKRVPHLAWAASILALVATASPCWGQTPSGPSKEEQEALLSLLPRKTESPELRGRSVPEFYDPRNLFDYINGQADAYLHYGFRLLITREYTVDEKTPITVEIYRMEGPSHAFGIYAAERTPEDQVLDIGGEGFFGANILAFWKGVYYCKFLFHQRSARQDRVILEAAGRLSDRIQGSREPPPLFALFPEEHRVRGSERFIPANFLGQTYLKNGYRSDYERRVSPAQMFLVQAGSPEEAREWSRKYELFLHAQGEKISRSGSGEDEIVWSRSEGSRGFFVCGPFLGGILNEKDAGEGERAIRAMIRKIRTQDRP